MSYYWHCLQCHKKYFLKNNPAYCSSTCEEEWEKSLSKYCYYCGNIPSDFVTICKKKVLICKECKIGLNSVYPSYFCCASANASPLLEWYEDKYKKFLCQIEWDEEELKGIGKNLRSSITIALESQYKIEARTNWLRYISKRHTCEEREGPKLQ